MLIRELLTQSIPFLLPQDKVHLALELMNEHHVAHLPVVEAEKYLGMVNEDHLLQVENDKDPISSVRQSYTGFSVKGNDHFLKALQTAADHGLSLVPVVDEKNEYLGIVSYTDLLKYASDFMSLSEPGGLVVLELPSNQYSFSEISKLVETNDAQITQLNTSNDAESGMMLVTLRINKTEISDIVSTFQRYEYNVKYFFGEEIYENDLRTNYDNLMNYLNIG